MKKQMNIVLTALTVIALMGAVSCNKVEELEGNGSTIRFGVSTIYENGPATKTEYSGKDQNNNSISSTSTAERIDWLDTDKIRIQCAQASVEGSSDKYADYAITPGAAGTTRIHTATISPLSGNGLQWGTGSHDFYALYPSTAQNSASTIALSGTCATVGGTIPAAQTPTKSGYIFKPDMDYAYMYAVKAGVSAGSSVSLDFKPLVTTLEFTLLTKAGDPITSKLTSVKLSSSQSTSYLTGSFTAELTTSGLTALTKDDITGGGNEITITLPDDGVQLSTNANEAYTVTFLTLPLDQTELTLTLGFADSSKRTLKLKDNGSWITVDACKKTYIWKLDAPKTTDVVTVVTAAANKTTFNGYKMSEGILKYDTTNGYTVTSAEDAVLCLNEYVTASAAGKAPAAYLSANSENYYFNWEGTTAGVGLKALFSSSGSGESEVLTSSKSSISSSDSWRVPTQAQWESMTGTPSSGYTTTISANGGSTSGSYRRGLIKVNFADASSPLGSSALKLNSGTTSSVVCMVLFPDGCAINFASGYVNLATGTSAVSAPSKTMPYSEYQKLLTAGCVVLPVAGLYIYGSWSDAGYFGYYWSATSNSSYYAYVLHFCSGNFATAFDYNKSSYYFPVRLVAPLTLATYSIASAIADISQSGSGVTTGLNQDITVTVNKTVGASVTTQGAWKAYFYTSAPAVGDEVSASWSETPLQDAGSNDWLTLSSYTGDGTGNAVSVAFTGAELSGATMDPGTTATSMISALQSGAGVTNLDLSTYNILDGSTGAAETANSYVIKTHGSYLIPCVYGNAYTGGAVNAGAYSNSTTGTNPLNTFINADGNAIGSAVITSDPNLTMSSHLSARVVWQDVMPGFEMITDANLEYVSTPGTAVNCPYIRVTFPQDKIVPGNVVVALYDDDNAKILWSWHLWVTTESLTTVNVLQSDNTTSHNFLNVNLGWTPPISYTANTSARDQYVIIVCTETGKVIDSFHVSQAAYSISALTCTQYSSTYYQWGRKDAFLPSSGSNTNKAISYNTSIITPTVSSTNQIEKGAAAGSNATEKLGWMTKNPYMFNTDYNNVPNYYNLWDAGQGGTGDHEVVKTVYDPSPRGFKLPNRNAFTGFTSNGNNQSSASNIYGDWVSASGEQPAGRNFSTTHSTSGKTFFIPASGYRYGSHSQLYEVSSYGYYWSAAPSNAAYGYYLYFYSSGVGPQNYTSRRTYGFSVRPVQE